MNMLLQAQRKNGWQVHRWVGGNLKDDLVYKIAAIEKLFLFTVIYLAYLNYPL